MFNSKYINFYYFGLIIFLIFFSIVKGTNGGDFDVYLDAARRLVIKDNIYAAPHYEGLQYFYSPFWAWLLSIFNKIPYGVVDVFWLFLQCFGIYRCFKLAFSYLNENGVMSNNQYWKWIISTFLLIALSVNSNFESINITIFLVWISLESLNFIFIKNNNIIGGALLALIINIKIMPIMLLPYLFYRGCWRAIGAVLFFLGVYFFIPSITIGWTYNIFLHQEWWAVVNPSNNQHTFEKDFALIGIVPFVNAYFSDAEGAISWKRNFIALSPDEIRLLINIFRVVFIIGCGFFLKFGTIFKPVTSRRALLYETSYIFLCTPLLFPHQQPYCLYYLMPAYACLNYYFLDKKSTSSLFFFYIFICALMIIPGRDFTGNFIFNVFQHFKHYTVGVFLLLFTLWTVKNRLNKTSYFL